MKYVIPFFLVLTTMFLLYSCKSNKKIVLDSYQGPRLVFGSGGGFAGTSSERILLPNGQVFLKANRSKQYSVCESIDKKQAEQMFANFKTLGLDKMELDDPGNMTFFISMEDKGKVRKITWGGGNTRPDPIVKKYFNTLGQLTHQKQAIK